MPEKKTSQKKANVNVGSVKKVAKLKAPLTNMKPDVVLDNVVDKAQATTKPKKTLALKMKSYAKDSTLVSDNSKIEQEIIKLQGKIKELKVKLPKKEKPELTLEERISKLEDSIDNCELKIIKMKSKLARLQDKYENDD
jgi:chromosome segregation ATPase